MVVLLESFEGPLDLLLYLVRKQNLNILNFSLAAIADQYMQYIESMTALRLQLAGEYLVVASTLMVIKSRALLPQLEGVEVDEDDPAVELRQRLIAYERLKDAAERLNDLPQVERDVHNVHIAIARPLPTEVHPEVDLKELLSAFGAVLARAKLHQEHSVARPTISVRKRMTDILDKLKISGESLPFDRLFNLWEGKLSLIASLLAILELMRSSMVRVIQKQPFAPIFVSLVETAEIG